MNYYQENKTDLLLHLNSDEKTGLSDHTVVLNRNRYGSNAFTISKKPSIFKRIYDATCEPMIIMLLLAAVITLGINLIQYFTGREADIIETIGIFIAIFLAVGITVLMEGKSEKAFDALNAIKDNTLIKVIRNGTISQIYQKDIVVGDIIEINTGDMIPADGRLLSSSNLRIDESCLTGESKSVKKNHNYNYQNSNIPIAEQQNIVYSGCFVTQGIGKFITIAVGDHTEFGSIAQELAKTQKKITPLQEKLNRLGKIITILGSTAAGIVFISQLIIFSLNGTLNIDTISVAFITSIVLIVAAVPEGLPTIVAVSLSINIIKMAKENALVKKLIACETIGCINVLCSDKTGTLTQNCMTVTDISRNTHLLKPNDPLTQTFINHFCLNSTADLSSSSLQSFIGNPTEGALLIAYNKSLKYTSNQLSYREVRNHSKLIYRYSFSSETKKMTSIIKHSNTFLALSKGSPELILTHCNFIRINEDILPLTPEHIMKIEKEIETLQFQAKRVLAFSSKKFTQKIDYPTQRKMIESDMVFDGYVAITDPLRKEVPAAILKSREAGIDLKILTGDNIVTAKAIANQLGMINHPDEIIEAKEIETLSDNELNKRIDKIKVIARSTPIIKMRVVNALKSLGNVVAVTGDGINDAPAIKNADVGIAMGICGTDVSKEASDIVLLDDSFSTILKAIQWGRGIYENFQRFIQFQLTVNLSSVIVVLATILIGGKAPFTALQLLWINIIMDGPPALTLGLEPIRENLLLNPPISRDANIVNKKMLSRIISNGLYISIIFMLQLTTNFLNGTSFEKESILFTLFVVMHLFNAFNSRELSATSIFVNFKKNWIMLIVFGITFLLQVIITQFGGIIYHTFPLSLMMWFKIICLGLSVVLVSEVIKIFKCKCKKIKKTKIKRL